MKELTLLLAERLCNPDALWRRQQDPILTGLPGRASLCARIPLSSATCHCRNLKDLTATLQNAVEWQPGFGSAGQRKAELPRTKEGTGKGHLMYPNHAFFRVLSSPHRLPVILIKISSLFCRLTGAPAPLCIHVCLFPNGILSAFAFISLIESLSVGKRRHHSHEIQCIHFKYHLSLGRWGRVQVQ